MKKAYVVICIVILLTVGSLAVKSFLSDDLVFAGKPPRTSNVPPYSATVTSSVVTTNYGARQIQVGISSTIGGRAIPKTINSNVFPAVETVWGVLHLPSGDVYSATYDATVQTLQWDDIDTVLPSFGTSISAEIFSFYAGKTIRIPIIITNWE